ncbi:MAG TPA: 23S rRNA (uracil(1939)-C(5))-methyltransferase RlmD [bacterium]|nr:23S rRNA (uracil(1939)-C(5))-methyltransferase RlmD [bacterium]
MKRSDKQKKWSTGDLVELEIETLSFGSRGVARSEGFVWFVDRALPGQKVMARIRKVKKQYGEASVAEVLEPGPHQIQAPCPYFGTCGGCQLQHMDYSAQVESKTRQIQEILAHLGGIPVPPVRDTLPSEKIFHYRNKMEFTFSDRRWILPEDPPDAPRDFALGLHVPRQYQKVLDIDACLLQEPVCNDILSTLRELIPDTGLPPYSVQHHSGFWRFLVMRTGARTGDVMLNFLTSGQMRQGDEVMDTLAETLRKRHPQITTLIHSISDSLAQVAYGEASRVLFGTGKISEVILDRRFEISPDAFFQTNSFQCESLFRTIMELGDFKKSEIVYDLYCGTGAIGIVLAHRVRKVVGIEVIPQAVEDARRNAEINRLDNTEFILADMKDALHTDAVFGLHGLPDAVILDPPRGGTHPRTIRDLVHMAPPRIVYVSCNPAILARDLQFLHPGYDIEAVQPVDMFPHTGHIETVSLLTKRKS